MMMGGKANDRAKKTALLICICSAAIVLGAAALIIIILTGKKTLISSKSVESVRARNAIDPTAVEEFTDEEDILRLTEHFNSLELSPIDYDPEKYETSLLSVEFAYHNGAIIRLYQLGNRFIRIDDGDWMEIKGEPTAIEAILNSAKYASLRERFPQYFDIGLEKGLDVFAWKENGEFRFGIAPMTALFGFESFTESPTELEPLEENELVNVLKSYMAQGVRAFLSNAFLTNNDDDRIEYHIASLQLLPRQPYSSVYTPWMPWASEYYDYDDPINDPTKYAPYCIRLLPFLERDDHNDIYLGNLESAKADHSLLKSVFERSIEPLFEPYKAK